MAQVWSDGGMLWNLTQFGKFSIENWKELCIDYRVEQEDTAASIAFLPVCC